MFHSPGTGTVTNNYTNRRVITRFATEQICKIFSHHDLSPPLHKYFFNNSHFFLDRLGICGRNQFDHGCLQYSCYYCFCYCHRHCRRLEFFFFRKTGSMLTYLRVKERCKQRKRPEKTHAVSQQFQISKCSQPSVERIFFTSVLAVINTETIVYTNILE